ncbi:4Fe-4S binding protein [Deferribacteraceae bacterium V6Fe1]|nr:4Fe-4S binding protein [Deferribacteraceae bacterium V6Fe1]
MNSILKYNYSKSYTSVIKPAICLIYCDYKKLQHIKNVLGGVYSLKPLSVSKIFSPDFLSVTDFKVNGKFPNFYISFSFYDSVDFEKCTYCGKCYNICPEKCITTNLEIDFNICTLCGECEKVCPEKAIDIDKVVSDNIYTSFIVTDIEEFLNKNQTGIFEYSDIEKILSMTGEFLIEENVIHSQDLCQYNGKLNYGCKRCIEECNHEALTIEDNVIVIDHLACEACGKCVAVCPTGAMQYVNSDDNNFISSFSGNNIKDKILIAGDDEQLRKFKWNNSNKLDNIIFLNSDPKFFNLMHYLFVFAIGASNIVVLNDKLSESNQVLFANRLLEYLFKYKNFIKTKYNFDTVSTNPLPVVYTNYSFASRRKKLASILNFLFESSSFNDVLIEENYLNIFGEVIVDEGKCSLCLACVNHCKIGALLSNEFNYSLNHNPSICIQCKICEYVCPEDAISVKEGLLLSEKFFEVNELCRDEPIVCPGCNKAFGSKKSFEAVKLKLSGVGLLESKGKFLHYCEECRVKRLFEN